MICYVGAAQNEKQAQNAMKKYGKWTHPDPANPTVDVLWNGAVAMVAGCKLIVGYQDGTTNSAIACRFIIALLDEPAIAGA